LRILSNCRAQSPSEPETRLYDSFPIIALAAERSNTHVDNSVYSREARTVPQDPVIEIKDVGGLSNVLLLDVRDQAAFDADHTDGVVRVPIEVWVDDAKNSETSFADIGFWQQQIISA
jgi:hypothetical protein